jgi:uncharacterized protein
VSGLRIAPGLELDADYVAGGTFALLAKKGAGKTYTGRVMAEEFWKAKVPFVVLDPMGAWWGLRSSADGKGEGIPVAIFGGEHGDAPLERGGGAVMGDLVVDEGLSMILDMKGLGSRAAERQFALDFLERLYRRNSELVHLFVDEADLFAPQKPQAGDQQLLGVTENIVRRGRNSGIGITLITQRPAVLNKDVLTQVDGLVAMRITGYTDREAIDDWVKGHADQDIAREVKPTLAGLANGECWWWIPELDVLKCVQVRKAKTFDSSPTRKRGETKREPKAYADVDMDVIQARMAETIERAKAADPKELQRRIRDLEKQLRERPVEQAAEPRVERIEIPVLANGVVDQLSAAVAAISDAAGQLQTVGEAIAGELRRVEHGAASAATVPRKPRATAPRPAPPARSVAQRPVPSGTPEAPPAQLRILNALAQLEAIGMAQPSKTQLALFAGASPKSSGYTNNLGALRSAGLIDYLSPGTASLTNDGRAIADATAAPSTVEEMHAYVRELVGGSRWRILEVLVDVYPEALAKDELAERAGVSASSSGYTNNLGSLRSLGLIDYPAPGHAAATPVLFLEGGA